MKNQILTLAACSISLFGYAQKSMKLIPALETVFVSDIKTTHLIFDEDIKYVDLGSPYFVADTLQPIVKIKHIGEDVGKPISQVTNLTVITESGTYYSIPIRYNRDTIELTHRITATDQQIGAVQEAKKEIDQTEKEIDMFVKRLDFAQDNVNLANKREDFGITTKGIFYQKDYMALRVELYNGSTIDLDIDQILFRLKLRKKFGNEYIYQERIVKPFRVLNETTKIDGYQTKTMTMLFKKFTPNEHENLVIDVLEANGGRSSKLTIERKKLLNPKSI